MDAVHPPFPPPPPPPPQPQQQPSSPDLPQQHQQPIAPPPFPVLEDISRTAIELGPAGSREPAHHPNSTTVNFPRSTNSIRSNRQNNNATGSMRLLLSKRDRDDLAEKGDERVDCLCIKSTVLGSMLCFIIIIVKLLGVLWCALVAVQTPRPTDYVIIAMYGIEMFLAMGYFVNYKTLYSAGWNQITWLLMFILTIGEIGVYCAAVFLDKRLTMFPDQQQCNPSQNQNVTTTASPETRQVYQTPPIESVFLGILFASTVFRVWLSQPSKPKPSKPLVDDKAKNKGGAGGDPTKSGKEGKEQQQKGSTSRSKRTKSIR